MPQNKLKRDARLGNDNQLPGFPGYRTRPGHTGYDPLDTNREAAFMEGTFYRNLFTLRLRTRNTFYLILMFVFGALPFAALLVGIVILISDAFRMKDMSGLGGLVWPSIFAIITGALTINLVLSILEIRKIIPPLRSDHSKRAREQKKKMPKRRKDFQ